MKEEWKPGDLAMVGTLTGPEYLCIWTTYDACRHTDARQWNGHWHTMAGTWIAGSREGRRLIVIDPDDYVLVERLRNSIRSKGINRLGEALRSLNAPPKPLEPGSFGSVVEDYGVEWFRWTNNDHEPKPWAKKDGPNHRRGWSNFTDRVVVVREGV